MKIFLLLLICFLLVIFSYGLDIYIILKKGKTHINIVKAYYIYILMMKNIFILTFSFIKKDNFKMGFKIFKMFISNFKTEINIFQVILNKLLPEKNYKVEHKTLKKSFSMFNLQLINSAKLVNNN